MEREAVASELAGEVRAGRAGEAGRFGDESFGVAAGAEEGEEVDETIIRRRERFSHELTLAFENGRILELKESKENVVAS